MAITLDTLTLPSELRWIDEYSWSAVKSNIKYSLQGRRKVAEYSVYNEAGRPITLVGEDSWITKSDLDTLLSWSEDTDKQMTLTFHDSSVKYVRFRFSDNPFIEVTPISPTAYPSASTVYRLTLKLEVY